MDEQQQTKERKKDEKPLEKMTIKELRSIAMEIPRSVSVHDMKKEELIAFIKEARGETEEKSVYAAPEAYTYEVSKTELKRKIRALKEERKEAQRAKERKKASLLRRRISRLKKRIRRLARA